MKHGGAKVVVYSEAIMIQRINALIQREQQRRAKRQLQRRLRKLVSYSLS